MFYKAEIEAIGAARHGINLEACIIQKGEAAGTRVNMVLDAIGSFASWNSYFREPPDSGGKHRGGRGLAARLDRDFRRDAAHSREAKLSGLRSRPIFEAPHECLGWLFERQQ